MGNDVKNYLETITKGMKMLRKGGAPKGWPYHSMEEFVLKEGRPFILNGDKTKKGTIKQCYRNAFYLAEKTGLIYVEGYGTTKKVGIPLMHAWCVDENGNVHDPTWRDGDEYYGVPFNMDYLRRTMRATKVFGVLDNWKLGFPLMSGKDKDFRAEVTWKDSLTS